mmetsp:Transcript_100990/g.253188  ORF Transcript_100990/g.253188 Transcript_100990/m.253188 type:complete len:652 (-) Transcript_100990:462-2417(-)
MLRSFTASLRRSAWQGSLTEMWAGGASVSEVAEESFKRVGQADRHEWIHRLTKDEVMQQAKDLEQRAAALDPVRRKEELPLLGMTFGVKDNIEVAGLPVTNACDYRSKPAPVAKQSAAVVARFQEQGAVLLGKTNLDCAATGLVGVRSAYGACQNAFDRAFISGGSSSGSGVAVSTGQVSFSLGTDTAGSGRVPAALNNIVGLKASRGMISTHGLLPACRSLDCISIFALTTREAQVVLGSAASVGEGRGPDPWDRPNSDLRLGPRLADGGGTKFTFGIPSQRFLDFSSFGQAAQARSQSYKEAWERSVESLKAIGGTCVEVDYAPFQEAAELLYQGPWVAERLSALTGILSSDPDVVHPTVRKIVEQGHNYSAQQCFEAAYRMRELKVASEKAMATVGAQVLVTPTVGATYTIEDVLADPIALNSNLGRYTNHMNLLDLCGISVPTTFASDTLPFGVTVSAPAGNDALICDVAHHVHLASNLKAGSTASSVSAVAEAFNSTGCFDGALPRGTEVFEVAVCGAHMDGLALCWQLLERGGRFMRKARTAPGYRLVAFDGMKPPRPGLVDSPTGSHIDLEIWELPAAAFGSFMKLVAPPLGIGWIELEDGSKVQGFRQVDVGADRNGVVTASGVAPPDVTHLGGWRGYLANQK